MDESRKPLVIIITLVAIVFLLVGIWYAFLREKPIVDPGISEITMTKENASITLNKEGTLIVRNKYGLFQQQWDEDRVEDFFSRFGKTNLSSLSQQCEIDGYCLTVTLADGSEVTYYIPFDDGSLPDVIEELIETLEELDDVIPSPTPTPEVSVSPDPTPPFGSSPTPTPNPTPTPIGSAGGGGDGDGDGDEDGDGPPDYSIPFICDFLDPNIKPNILSETLCTP